MILGGAGVSRQTDGAGFSLHHCALLVVQDVLHQAAHRLLNVCVFLVGKKKKLKVELTRV